MLSKKNRLNLKTEFKSVISGRKLETKYTTLFFKYRESADKKVGIAVPSRVFKKAHDRNRARRTVSAALEVIFPNLKPGLNIIVLPKPGVLEVKSTNVTEDLFLAMRNNDLLI